MKKQIIFRSLLFACLAGGIIFMLVRLDEKKRIKGEERVLPAQVEKMMKEVRDFPEKEEVKFFKKKVLGDFQGFIPKSSEEKVEQNVRQVINEIQSLPEQQLEQVKKAVFCTEVCKKTCQDVCE